MKHTSSIVPATRLGIPLGYRNTKKTWVCCLETMGLKKVLTINIRDDCAHKRVNLP